MASILDQFGRPMSNGTARDPALLKNTGFAVSNVSTFSGIVGSVNKTYRWAFDEALRNSPHNALSMRRDGTIMALLRERQMPTAQSKWHLEPEDPKDPYQQGVADQLTDIVQAIPRFSRFRLQLLEAIWFGRYGNQFAIGKRIIKGQTRFTITNHQPVHGDKFIFRWDGTPGVLISQLYSNNYTETGLTGVTGPYVQELKEKGAVVLPTDRGLALFLETPQWRERFAIHMHESEDADFTEPELAGGIYGVGLRHRCYWLWWLRNEVLSSLLDYLQRVGAGGLTLIGFEHGNDASEQAALHIGQQMEAGNVILVPRPLGDEKIADVIERIEPSSSGSETLMKIINEFFDAWLERLFVGQSMSAGADASNGMGGTGRANFAANTKDQLLQMDADALDECITDNVVQTIKRWNMPNVTFKVRFKTDLSKPNPKDLLESAKTIVDMGGTLVEDEILEIAGLSVPEPGDRTLGGQQAAGPEGGLPGAGPDEPPDPDEGGPSDGGASQKLFDEGIASGKMFTPEGLGQIRGQIPQPAINGPMKFAAKFEESKHKRNKGQFAHTAGSSGPKKDKDATAFGGGAKTAKDYYGFDPNKPGGPGNEHPMAAQMRAKQEQANAQQAQQPAAPQQPPAQPPLVQPKDAVQRIHAMEQGDVLVEPQTLRELVEFLIKLPRHALAGIQKTYHQVKDEIKSWPERLEGKEEVTLGSGKGAPGPLQGLSMDRKGLQAAHARLKQPGAKPALKTPTPGVPQMGRLAKSPMTAKQKLQMVQKRKAGALKNQRDLFPLKYDGKHAPKGGVLVQGKFYPGGQYIKQEVYDSATAEEKKAIDEEKLSPAEIGEAAGDGEDDNIDQSAVQKIQEEYDAAHPIPPEMDAELAAMDAEEAALGDEDNQQKVVALQAEFADYGGSQLAKLMGKLGWSYKDAKAALEMLGKTVSDNTIKSQLSAGKTGKPESHNSGKTANLSEAQKLKLQGATQLSLGKVVAAALAGDKQGIEKAGEELVLDMAQANGQAVKNFAPELSGELKKVKDLGGSGDAALYEDAAGEKFVLKGPSAKGGMGHLENEVDADKVYEAAGVMVPPSQIKGGKKQSMYLIGAQTLGSLDKSSEQYKKAVIQLKAGFAMDALLANWDVVGQGMDNVLVQGSGLAWRVDNGGSMAYRAQGGSKGGAWSDTVGELTSMRDKSTNPTAGAVFGSLTDEAVAKQIKALEPKLQSILDAAPAGQKSKLASRYTYMANWAQGTLLGAEHKAAIGEITKAEAAGKVQKKTKAQPVVYEYKTPHGEEKTKFSHVFFQASGPKLNKHSDGQPLINTAAPGWTRTAYATMSAEAARAIKGYTDGNYTAINEHLWQKAKHKEKYGSKKTVHENTKKNAIALLKMFQGLPKAKEPFTVYRRGRSGDEGNDAFLKKFEAALAHGDGHELNMVKLRGITSTATTPGNAEASIGFVIKANKAIDAVPLSSYKGGEHEVLLPHNARYRVLKVERGVGYENKYNKIYLEQL